MLILEVRVEDLGVGEHTKDLVMHLSSVDKFMAGLGLKCTYESDNIPEHNQLWPCHWSYCGEVIRIELDVIAE